MDAGPRAAYEPDHEENEFLRAIWDKSKQHRTRRGIAPQWGGAMWWIAVVLGAVPIAATAVLLCIAVERLAEWPRSGSSGAPEGVSI